MNNLHTALNTFNTHATRLGLIGNGLTALITDPVLGKHENVVSIYIESLYPNIMTNYNLGSVQPLFSNYLKELRMELAVLKQRRANGEYNELAELYSETKIAINSAYGLICNPESPYYCALASNLVRKYANKLLDSVCFYANSIMADSVIYADLDTVYVKLDGNVLPVKLAEDITNYLNQVAPTFGDCFNPKFNVSVDTEYSEIEFTGKKRFTGKIKD
jgi:DNA polymerase elongation subunit (family B)